MTNLTLKSSRKQVLFLSLSLLLLLICVLPYLIALNGDFVYDDLMQIVMNRKIHNFSDLHGVIFNGFREIRLYQNLSFAWNWSISPGQGWSFRLFNIFLHFLNTLLVFRFLWVILKDKLLVTFVTLLYFIHPLQIESVTYIMGRIGLIQGFFYFVILNILASRWANKSWLLSLVTILSLPAKESCILIPFVILAYDLTLGEVPGTKRAKIARYVPVFSSMLFMIPVYAVLSGDGTMYKGTTGFNLYPFGEYLFLQMHYFLFHLYLVFAPSNQSIIHPYEGLNTLRWITSTLGTLSYVGLCILSIRWRKKFPLFSFMWCFYLISTGMTTFIQMINPFAEYRLYQANLTCLLALGFFFDFCIRKVEDLRLRAFAMICVVALFWHMNALQQFQWESDIVLYKSGIAVYPNYSKLYYNLGISYEGKGNMEKAEAAFEKALECSEKEPYGSHVFRVGYAEYLMTKNRLEKAAKLLNERPTNPAILRRKPTLVYFDTYLKVLSLLKNKSEYDRVRREMLILYPNAKPVEYGETKKEVDHATH